MTAFGSRVVRDSDGGRTAYFRRLEYLAIPVLLKVRARKTWFGAVGLQTSLWVRGTINCRGQDCDDNAVAEAFGACAPMTTPTYQDAIKPTP